MRKNKLLTGKLNLHLPRKSIVLCTFIIVVVWYIILSPSSSLFYDYIPAEEISGDIVAAVGNVTRSVKKPLCPIAPLHLGKTVWINFAPNLTTLAKDYSIKSGGAWRPTSCVSRHRVAIIVPYKNRQRHLQIFLYHMHSFLCQQFLEYRILVIEQTSRLPFNRAALFNVGYAESLKLSDYHCFIFHDVDLLPTNTANMYACSQNPRHMSVSINVFRFNLLYKDLFGGAIAMTRQQFEAVNGYSNSFFGWGAEDDNMADRILDKGMKISRWDPKVCRYHMLRHAKAPPNHDRFLLLETGRERYDSDGLNTLKYTVLDQKEDDLFTWFLVDFPNREND